VLPDPQIRIQIQNKGKIKLLLKGKIISLSNPTWFVDFLTSPRLVNIKPLHRWSCKERRSGERGISWGWADSLLLVCHLHLFVPNFSRVQSPWQEGGVREREATEKTREKLSLGSRWMFYFP